jgi:glutaredoxin
MGLLLLGASVSCATSRGAEPQPVTATNLATVLIESEMRQVPVTMYMTEWCPVCMKARTWLKDGGFRFSELDVERDFRARSIMRSLNPRGAVPMFDVDGRIVIGFDPELLELTIRHAAVERQAVGAGFALAR